MSLGSVISLAWVMHMTGYYANFENEARSKVKSVEVQAMRDSVIMSRNLKGNPVKT